MNLAEAIHAHWATSSELTALLPASRFFTGAPPDDQLPWASLVGWRAAADERFPDGSRVERVEATVEIHSAHVHHAEAAAEALRRRFDRANLAMEGGDRILACRCLKEEALARAWGHWVFAVGLELMVHRAGSD